MLNENEVIRLLKAHLEKLGFTVLGTNDTRQQGVDLIAQEPESGNRLFLEAKGETSSKPESPQFGSMYGGGKTRHQVALGFYQAVCLKCKIAGDDVCAGLAFPDTPGFRTYLDPILPAVRSLNLKVFLVSERSGGVTEFG